MELLRFRQVPRLPKGMTRVRRYREQLSRSVPAVDRHVFDEAPTAGFDARLLELTGPALLRGYFQDERYFAHRSQEISARFRPPSQTARAWFAQLGRASIGRRVVAIGFREGADYARLGWILPDEYYREALLALSGQPDQYAFAVFGDSPQVNMSRARRLLGQHTWLASAHHLHPTDQLAAMALFETLIIPNSTFSWWGAWLADAAHQGGAQVIAPEPWLYNDQTAPVPDRWHKVERPAPEARTPAS